MKLTEILNNLSLKVQLEPEVGDIEISYVSSISETAKNSVMFINRSGYNPLKYITNSRECLIFVTPKIIKEYGLDTYGYIPSTRSSYLEVPDPKLLMYTIITKLGINKVYNLDTSYLLPKYHKKLIDRSRFIARTAKIYNAIVGANCSFHELSYVGLDDFSPYPDSDGNLTMFPQLGNVVIGDNVSIHLYSTVGRGALGSTIIGDHTKIDSYCQVGHNCIIGKNCILAASTILAGGVTVGDGTSFGIGSKVNNGVKIGNNVLVAAGSVVTKDIPDNTRVAGVPAKPIGVNPDNWNSGKAFE